MTSKTFCIRERARERLADRSSCRLVGAARGRSDRHAQSDRAQCDTSSRRCVTVISRRSNQFGSAPHGLREIDSSQTPVRPRGAPRSASADVCILPIARTRAKVLISCSDAEASRPARRSFLPPVTASIMDYPKKGMSAIPCEKKKLLRSNSSPDLARLAAIFTLFFAHCVVTVCKFLPSFFFKNSISHGKSIKKCDVFSFLCECYAFLLGTFCYLALDNACAPRAHA